MGWERHETEKRRWRAQEMHVEEGRGKVFRVKVLLVNDVCVCACVRVRVSVCLCVLCVCCVCVSVCLCVCVRTI